jgi:hypothetical protein
MPASPSTVLFKIWLPVLPATLMPALVTLPSLVKVKPTRLT